MRISLSPTSISLCFALVMATFNRFKSCKISPCWNKMIMLNCAVKIGLKQRNYFWVKPNSLQILSTLVLYVTSLSSVRKRFNHCAYKKMQGLFQKPKLMIKNYEECLIIANILTISGKKYWKISENVVLTFLMNV